MKTAVTGVTAGELVSQNKGYLREIGSMGGRGALRLFPGASQRHETVYKELTELVPMGMAARWQPNGVYRKRPMHL